MCEVELARAHAENGDAGIATKPSGILQLRHCGPALAIAPTSVTRTSRSGTMFSRSRIGHYMLQLRASA